MALFWIIFSYFLGSLPFGYLIGKLSGKNVLEIGWRKTSGSNVFYNVGKWQGILTGLLDFLKGFFVVFGAKKFGFSTEIQIFSGVAAVVGHNWSIFLKFAGGRGIGTFFGAFLAFCPKIFFLSLVPFLLITLIWDASIATLLFFLISIFLANYFDLFHPTGIFILISLFPILLKRLSPTKDIFLAKNPLILIRNRLLFDNNEAISELRIKKFLKRKSEKIAFILNIFIKTLLLPPKISWEATKFGTKIAANGIKIIAQPLQKIFLPEKIVTNITPEEFKKMMVAASKKIVFYQEEINKINVWPIADKDTGYNLAATLLGIEGTINKKEYQSFLELSQDIKDASMINARGNAGMIFTGYLISFLDQIT